MKNLIVRMAAALVALLPLAATAAIELRTGVDSNGVVMSAGSVDTDWQISTNGGAFTDTKVLYPLSNPNDLSSGQICCQMQTVASTAAWISDPSITSTTGSTDWGIGQNVRIRTTFDLAGYDLSTVALSGTWRIADYTMGIYLNGNLIPGTAVGAGGPSAYTFQTNRLLSVVAGSPFFLAGSNTLEFVGQSINSGWDGLWFDGTVDGRQVGAVPIPAPALLLGAGLAALAGIRRRKQ